jgi:hypothetical protein
MRRLVPVVCVAAFLLGSPLSAQDNYRKHNLTVTAGAGLPRGDLSDVFANSFGAGFSYHYRFLPYLAAEAGYESMFGAARVRDYLPTSFGSFRIRDYQQFFPFGGRVIMPLLNDRIQVFGSGGGAYFRYSERVRQPFGNYGYRLDCPVCAVRDGFGYYAGVGANFALDQGQHFRLGFIGKVYRGGTAGDPFGDVPGHSTVDRWITLSGSFGFSF